MERCPRTGRRRIEAHSLAAHAEINSETRKQLKKYFWIFKCTCMIVSLPCALNCKLVLISAASPYHKLTLLLADFKKKLLESSLSYNHTMIPESNMKSAHVRWAQYSLDSCQLMRLLPKHSVRLSAGEWAEWCLQEGPDNKRSAATLLRSI